ncbi:MAG: hypothetical protein OXT67_09585 [Zetaproteobacteria bacterium]|nr:hypothetical protein [Zetaproteobacteria bacterium]
MTLRSNAKLTSQVQIYNENGHFDFKKIIELTGFTPSKFAKCSGLSVSTIQKNLSTAKNNRRHFLKELEYVVTLLAELADNDETEMKLWFSQPKIFWKGLSPLDLIQMDQIEVVKLELERKLHGEIS